MPKLLVSKIQINKVAYIAIIQLYYYQSKSFNMSIEYVNSQRSKKVIFNQFVYLKERESQGTTYWRCENRGTCSSRIHVYCDTVVKDTNSHNHAPDAARIEVLKALTKMDELTTTSDMMPQCIIGSVSLQLPDSAKVQLSKISSLERSLRNKRVDTIAAPQKYERDTLIFPDLTKNLPSGESFVLYDSIGDNPRFIIFGTPASLAALTSCSHIFKSSPSIFFQLYTLHGLCGDITLPFLMCLFSDKQQNTYNRLFSAIKMLRPNFNPATINIDFEHAVINAASKNFTGAQIWGCFFHFSQAVWRNLQRHGLRNIIQKTLITP